MSLITSILRYPSCALFAFVLTAALFYLMKSLIEVSGIVVDNAPLIVVDFVKPLEMTPLATKRIRAEPPRPPELPPPAPPLRVSGEGPSWVVPKVDPPQGPAAGPRIDGYTDGAMLPIVRVQPTYPVRAAQRGIEGYVVVEFDVGPQGAVSNARVVDHAPSSIFDSAALEAIKRFRYKPEVSGGRPVTVTGVQNRFTFVLERG